ncbi:MAG: hypothetical protein J6B54_07120 [Clostridia bacterium]|nr:hypothetical protein [Clostridia bacterium]
MLKKAILSTLLCVALALSFVACGPAENPQTDSGGTSSGSSVSSSDTNSDTATDGESTDASTATEGTTTDTRDEVKKDDPYWEEDAIGRKIIACDIINFSVVVYDLDACQGDYQRLINDKSTIVWEWSSVYDRNCVGFPGGLSSAKLRYSPYYGKDVVIACSSNGWWGVVDYEKCTVICEGWVSSGPHSVEMLPNGDLVIGVSAKTIGVYYIPLSAGVAEPVSELEAPACHGVCWDPERQCIWVLEGNGVFRATVENMGTKQAKLVRHYDNIKVLGNSMGHAFSPIYGQPGKYWVSENKLLIFDATTGEYTSAGALSAGGIKGVASFADGSVVEAICNLGGNAVNFYACDGFRILEKRMSEGKVQVVKYVATDVIFPIGGRQFYKVQPFTRNYL